MRKQYTCYSGCKRYWPAKIVSSVVRIYGNSSGDPLICSFFKEEIRLASPISMETGEGPTPNSDLDQSKENTQTIVKDSKDHLKEHFLFPLFKVFNFSPRRAEYFCCRHLVIQLLFNAEWSNSPRPPQGPGAPLTLPFHSELSRKLGDILFHLLKIYS